MIELADEATQLKRLEDIIQHSKERAETHWFEIGKALCKIRDGKLHKQKTFEQYCLQRWGFKRSRAYQLCKTFETLKASNKSTAVDLSQLPSEKSARELSKVPEEERAEVLDEAKKSGKPTGKSVKAAAKKTAPKPERPKDKTGLEIPERALPIWNRRGEVREKLAPLYELKQWALDMQGAEDPLWNVRGLDFAKLAIAIDAVIYALKQAIPDTICSKCQGNDPECDFCYGRGLISKALDESVTPIEMRKIRKQLSRSNDNSQAISGASR